MFRRNRKISRDKFTLVELLVVIAIIAVLAGMLMPALSSARERGRSASCINIIKQYGMANLMYANDYKVLCPIKDPGSQTYYYGTRGGSHGSFTYNLASGGFLHPYLGNSPKAFVCPSFDVGGSFTEATQVGGIGYNRLAWSGTVGDGDLSISNGKTSPESVMRSSAVVMFGDAGLYAAGMVSGTGYLVPNGIGMSDKSGSAHFRHNDMANLVWIDGHVSSERFLDGTELKTGHWGSSDPDQAYRYFWPGWSPSTTVPPEN